MIVLLLGGCSRVRGPLPADPDVNFAAHQARDGLAVDRLPSGRAARLESGGWLSGPGRASYVLRLGDDPLASYWIYGRSRVIVREGASSLSPSAGEVIAAWDGGTIRLTIHEPNARVLRTDTFAREGGGTGPSTLSRAAQTVLDVRGTYRAALRDGNGAAVGWLRARIGPDQHAPRIYDGVLPAEVGDGLGLAAALLLDGEITWIEDHATDVHRGTGDAPLEKSIPR